MVHEEARSGLAIDLESVVPGGLGELAIGGIEPEAEVDPETSDGFVPGFSVVGEDDAEGGIELVPSVTPPHCNDAEVRQRTVAEGASLWWTGRDGAVVVSFYRPVVARGLAPAERPGERWRCQGEAAR